MQKFCTNLRKHATEIIIYKRKEMFPLTDEEIESQNNKKFCHFCQTRFHDVDDSDDDSNDNDDSNDAELDVRKFHGNAEVLDDVDDDDHNNDSDDRDKEIDLRKTRGDAGGFDDNDGDDDDDDN